MKILIVEDEKLLADALKVLLEKQGFEADAVYDGESGLLYSELGVYDLVILDVMLPKINGWRVAQNLRARQCGVPILMLTARADVEDRITGLDSGADYYLTKPFDQRELLACVNALLRRHGDQVNEITFGNTSLELNSCNLVCGNERVRLSAKEFEVMRQLFQADGGNLSKETILVRVWGYETNAVENYVEVYIRFLRKKLESIGSNVRIESIRRFGYHLEVSKA